MIEDEGSGREIPKDSEINYFNEEKYIDEKPEDFDEVRRSLLRETPSVENIYEFIKALYDCAQFSPECCIICLVYVNRIYRHAPLPHELATARALFSSGSTKSMGR